MSALLHVWTLLFLLLESRNTEGNSSINTQANQYPQLDHVTRQPEPRLLTPEGSYRTNKQLGPNNHDKLINKQDNAVHSFLKYVDTRTSSNQTRITKPFWNESSHNDNKYESMQTGNKTETHNFTEIHSSSSDLTNANNTEEELLSFQLPVSFGMFTPKDKFKCYRCRCYVTLDEFVVATCNENTRLDFNRIKSALRNDTANLTIINSNINAFMAQDFANLTLLKSLILSRNKVLSAVVNTSQLTPSIPLTHLGLSDNKIRTISDRSFNAMPQLLTLVLSNNNITCVSRFTFQGLYQLQQLNLSNNGIQLIEKGSFDDIVGLRILDLSSNIGLAYKIQLLPDMFKRLASLSQFYIERNYDSGTTYPNELIAGMRNLTELSIDLIGQDVILKPEMKFLKNLAVLDVGCRNDQLSPPKNVSASFLENVPYLHTVRFSNCPIQHVDPNVYTHVRNLTRLQFSDTYPYDIFKALHGLETLQNSSLTSLSLTGLVNHCPFIILAERHCQFLKNLLLEELDLSGNRIGYIEEGFINGLPLTLKRLVIRGNELVESRLLLHRLSFLKLLDTLDLGTYLGEDTDNLVDELPKSPDVNVAYIQDVDGNNDIQSTPSCYSTDQFRAASLCRKQFASFSVSCLDQKNDFDYFDKYVDAVTICDQHLLQNKSIDSNTNVTLPPNLRYLLATRFLQMNISGVFEIIRSAVNSSLDVVDISHCGLPKLPGVHTTIPPNIHAINIQSNYLKQIPRHLFFHENTLRYLTLANNVLGTQFAENRYKLYLFKGLQHLIYLDISMNMVFELPNYFFSGLKRLEVLIMNLNKLHVLNTTFSDMPQLRYLDLTKNSIGWISKETRDELDTIRTFHPLHIDLSDNPLRCTCEGLSVLTWIQTSNIHFVSKDFLRCHRDDGVPEDVGDLDGRVTSLRRQCIGNDVITVISAASIVLVFIVIFFGLMYRFRWQLRYIRHIALSRLVGFKPRESTSSAYKFDAFIVYSDMSRQFVVGDCLQELEVKRGHKLCVDDRDFMPGTLSVSAIVSAIQNSRKTVLILSPDFYDEEFSEYSVKMALMEEIYQKRSVLYLCVYQPLPGDEMCKSYDLLMVMKRNNYLEFPPETETSEGIRQNFWDQVSETIGRSAITNMPSVVELAQMSCSVPT
ncbi:hypothetical protein BsWGS_28315 [Bradybaena similaris]